MPQIKDIAITKTVAEDSDILVMQNPTTGETYKITKANLLAGLSSGNSGNGSNGSNSQSVALNYVSDGDDNGIFYYLGSNKKTASWTNPSGSRVTISASSTESGQLASLTDRVASEWYSNANSNNYVSFQLNGCKLKCNKYSIRSRANNTDYYPRNWILQGSNDGNNWTDLDTQTNNTTLSSISQWLSLPVTSATAYSYFRILQNGVDSSGVGYFCLGEVELYGVYTP